MTDQQRKIMKISDEILQLVDDRDDIPRTDIEGIAMAIAMKAVTEHKERTNI